MPDVQMVYQKGVSAVTIHHYWEMKRKDCANSFWEGVNFGAVFALCGEGVKFLMGNEVTNHEKERVNECLLSPHTSGDSKN